MKFAIMSDEDISDLNEEFSCILACLILVDADVAITADKLKTILETANVWVKPSLLNLFAEKLETEGRDMLNNMIHGLVQLVAVPVDNAPVTEDEHQLMSVPVDEASVTEDEQLVVVPVDNAPVTEEEHQPLVVTVDNAPVTEDKHQLMSVPVDNAPVAEDEHQLMSVPVDEAPVTEDELVVVPVDNAPVTEDEHQLRSVPVDNAPVTEDEHQLMSVAVDNAPVTEEEHQPVVVPVDNAPVTEEEHQLMSVPVDNAPVTEEEHQPLVVTVDNAPVTEEEHQLMSVPVDNAPVTEEEDQPVVVPVIDAPVADEELEGMAMQGGMGGHPLHSLGGGMHMQQSTGVMGNQQSHMLLPGNNVVQIPTLPTNPQPMNTVEEVDPITKAKSMLPHLEKSLKTVTTHFEHVINLRQGNDRPIPETVRKQGEEKLREFFSICDQIEAELYLAAAILKQYEESRKNFPYNVQEVPTSGQNTETAVSYPQYVNLVKNQVKYGQDITDILQSSADRVKAMAEKSMNEREARESKKS